jgi:prevent-host-death family protein
MSLSNYLLITIILTKLSLANLIYYRTMTIVNMHAAKTQLSKLVQMVLDGEEVIIGKAGKPLVTLTPFKANKPQRKPGGWEGKIWMADDFDAWTPELEEMFYGSIDEDLT